MGKWIRIAHSLLAVFQSGLYARYIRYSLNARQSWNHRQRNPRCQDVRFSLALFSARHVDDDCRNDAPHVDRRTDH